MSQVNHSVKEEYIKTIDLTYSYQLAKRMEENRSNPVLGYRTAGSAAEIATGDMLVEEMKKIGFCQVDKDPIQVDAWEFQKAELTYQNSEGVETRMILGAYQTTFITNGPQEFSLVYVGKGTEQEYVGVDVTGKLVLVDINQRNEWWISYPVYQAHLKGAAAVFAVQTGGYGEADEGALNAQDIAGPSEAAAFSICCKDAKELKKELELCPNLTVKFDAYTQVKRDQITYNIIGKIPGKNPNRMLLLSAHYDSYFDGFQDDNTAVSMMLSIGKTLLQINYQPENTIMFCAMAAEEWGVVDSPFDWSVGAYEAVVHAHPEWRGTVIADFNFELPAYAHGTRARIRSTYEYQGFLEECLKNFPELTEAYPEETKVIAPIETWSDDFSIAISGIPSMVNDFTGGSFMVTNYHSQFDNDSSYNEEVYRMHHEMFGLLLMEFDQTVVAPLNFTPVFLKAASMVDLSWCKRAGADGERLIHTLKDTGKIAAQVYEKVKQWNERALDSQEMRRLHSEQEIELQKKAVEARKLEKTLLDVFELEQDAFVRIDWYGNVRFPHENLLKNLELLTGAREALEEGEISVALPKLYQVNNNSYAFMFEEKVYQHFTESALNQSKDRLKWGWHRIEGYVNLYREVRSLLKKEQSGCLDYKDEIAFLNEVEQRQLLELRQCIDRLMEQTERMRQQLLACLI